MTANRRNAIRMDEDELRDFIGAQKSLQVGTIGVDGSVHLSTLWFAVTDDGIVFETYTKSQKIRNLERDDRVTLLLEDGDVYENLRGAMIRGHAELIGDQDRVHPLALAVLKRNQPDIPGDVLDEVARQMAAKRTAVLVRPESVVSWDHTKL